MGYIKVHITDRGEFVNRHRPMMLTVMSFCR